MENIVISNLKKELNFFWKKLIIIHFVNVETNSKWGSSMMLNII